MRLVAAIVALAIAMAGAQRGAKKNDTESQLKSNAEALKKTQQSIKKAEEKVKELEAKESGVLKTIAEIDNGLAQTRERLQALQKSESSLAAAIAQAESEMDALNERISAQKEAIALRVKNLYMHGKREEWELLYNLLQEHENPERKLYWVQKLLDSDKAALGNYAALMDAQHEKKRQLGAKQREMAELRESKSAEESKLRNQLAFQSEALEKVQKDKATQERAIAEYKRNQQTLAAVVAALEKKRQAEEKKKQEQASAQKAQQPAKGKVAIPKETPVAIGPKCAPLRGEIISEYGYHTNRELNIKIMHLGTEIRGQKGEGVKAAAAGSVAMIANLPGHGPSVIIDHKSAYYSVYGHLAGIKVKEGQEVSACQEIAGVGNAESANGYKLFFQVYKGAQTQDPMAWLRK